LKVKKIQEKTNKGGIVMGKTKAHTSHGGDTETAGNMKVEISNAAAKTGPGALKSDNSGQVWFDYSGKDYPSSIDWKKATTLTFQPHMGKAKTYHASGTEYFFQGGWTGPRLVLQRAHRK
jgi:hypothetical protein